MDLHPIAALRFKIEFPSPVFGAPGTHWRWKGSGELEIEGERITLTGKRRRPFWFAADQQVTISREQVRDVRQEGPGLTCVVELEGRTPEPLGLRFESESLAQQVAQRLPAAKSRAYQDHEAFALELARSGTRVFVAPVLVAACVLLFGILAVTGVPIVTPLGPEMIPWGTNYGPLTLNGQWWRLLTSMFLHFGLLHLLLNMWALWNMGPLMERLLGNVRFAALYLGAGLSGSIASLLWNPTVNSAGASGAIFGVLGAWLALTLNPATRIPRTVARSQRNSALIFVVYNVMYGLAHQGIDNAAHLGGLVGGFALGWLLARPLGTPKPAFPDFTLLRAAGGAAVVLAGFVWWLMHPDPQALARRDLALAVQQFAELESRAVDLQQSLYEQLERSKLTEMEWAASLEAQVEPLWKSAQAAVVDLTPGTDAALAEATTALQEYTRLRVQHLRLSVEGVQRQDSRRIDQAAKVGGELEAAAARVRLAFKKVKL